MFELTNHLVKVKHASPVYEKHGTEGHATGMKIQFVTTVNQNLLDTFSPALKHCLFRGQKTDDQMDIEFDNDGLVVVRHPRLKAAQWDEEFPGYEATLGAPGLGFDEPLTFVDVKLDGIAFRPLEGGSVELAWQLYVHPDSEEFGPIFELVKNEVELTLVPPKAQAQQQADLAA